MHSEHGDQATMVLSLTRDEVIELYRALVSASAHTVVDGLESYDLDHSLILDLKDHLRAHVRTTEQEQVIERPVRGPNTGYSW